MRKTKIEIRNVVTTLINIAGVPLGQEQMGMRVTAI